MAQWKRIQLGTKRWWVQSLASLSALRIRHYRELWYRLQTWLGSSVAVAVAVALIGPLAWEPPCVAGAALKKQKKKRFCEEFPL